MRVEADLHLHSYHSDGTLSPSELVSRAAAAGLKAIALTDHDTVDGVREATEAAPRGLTVIPGLELSASWQGREIHLLAYFVDHGLEELRAVLASIQAERRLRAERIVARLNAVGVGVTLDEVLAIACETGAPDRSSIGRPHVAEAIVRRGAARDLDDAFVRYLRKGRPGFVAKSSVPAGKAIELVRRWGGALVVAHPGLNLSDSETGSLAAAGLDGIEAIHPKHTEIQRRSLEAMARRIGLVASGGTDYHGPGRSRHEIGSWGVTLEAVDRLRDLSGSRGGAPHAPAAG